MTAAVADTGDLGAVPSRYTGTTTPTLALKAVDTPGYRNVVAEAVA
jgi:hypothetical protein